MDQLNDKQAIAFAFYKNGELMGYRQDTVGTIGMHPKIYTYSKEQVDIVLSNVNSNIKNPDGFGKALASVLGKSKETTILSNAERNVHNKLQEAKAFEVRVVKAPAYEYTEYYSEAAGKMIKYPVHPKEAIDEWIKTPENHEVIETHYFSFNGLINEQ